MAHNREVPSVITGGKKMKTLKRKQVMCFVAGLTALLMAVACGDDGDSDKGFKQPADTVAISFSIDDSANKTYTAGELQWKGSFTYDDATRILTHDAGWGGGTGPYPTLYDDGPWSAGGHEPAGETAGDSVWGITVFFPIPDTDTNFEYGAQNSDGGWIWTGDGNGTFSVTAGATNPITATGMSIEPFGKIDLRLSLDVNALSDQHTFTAGDTVMVKGSFAAWSEMSCLDDGTKGDETSADGVYTFVMSENVGAGTDFPHSGLLKSGDKPQFVFVIHGVEYKGTITGKTGSVPLGDGVKAEYKPDGGNWTEATITWLPDGDQNTYITVP
jgi:hypothetical protein